jgi:hypothetical protein
MTIVLVKEKSGTASMKDTGHSSDEKGSAFRSRRLSTGKKF